jgi:hypothetical protein
MDLTRKLEIVASAVTSIATHSDADSAVRLAALEAVTGLIDKAKLAIAHETATDVAALTATAAS